RPGSLGFPGTSPTPWIRTGPFEGPPKKTDFLDYELPKELIAEQPFPVGDTVGVVPLRRGRRRGGAGRFFARGICAATARRGWPSRIEEPPTTPGSVAAIFAVSHPLSKPSGVLPVRRLRYNTARAIRSIPSGGVVRSLAQDKEPPCRAAVFRFRR